MAHRTKDFDAGSEVIVSLATLKHSVPLIVMQFKEKRQTEDWYEYYRDDFDDEAIDTEWTQFGTGLGRTITELADVLTIAITGGTNGAWWCTTHNNAPRVYMELPDTRPLRIEAKLNSHTVNTQTLAGLMLAYNPVGTGSAAVDPAVAYTIGRYRDDAGGWNGIWVIDQCGQNGGLGGGAWQTLPQWYRIELDASNNATFYGSADGITWTSIWGPLAYDYDPLYAGLVTINWYAGGAWAARAAPFEYFVISVFEKRRVTAAHGYAPIDVRSDTAFYEGRIKQMSPLRRAIDDRTGLFQVADLNLTLANHDMEFSKLLTSHILKNQEVGIYHAWTDEAEVNKSHICTMIVEDHSLRGTHFNLKLKDITKKYFTKKVPTEICTEEDFPNIHPDHIGRRMPEILGFAVLDATHEHPGAVEAVYINTTSFIYLAAAGALVSVPAVYSDDVLMLTPGDYTVGVVGGRTYIDFVADQGDKTISFDAQGYSLAAWDSANGYVQNLSYIIEYFLRYLMDVPASMVNDTSFDTLATYFVNLGVDENCYLILQSENDATEILRQLLFTGGIKGFIAKDGRFKVERKDIHNYEITSLDAHLLSQIELFTAPDRQWNLLNAINTIKARYGYIPWQKLFKSAEETYRDNYYEEIMEDDIRLPREDLPA